MGVRRSRNADDLAAEGFGQIAELTFRVENEDVILGGKRDLHDFFLGAHALAGARHTQPKGVLPVIQTVRLHNFLCAERNQHSGAFGGERAQGLDFSQTVRQHRVQSVLLLPAQHGKLTQVLARRGVKRFSVAVELLFAVSQMHECHKTKHHPLVTGSQIVQHFLGFLALQLHVIRNRGGKIVVGVLAALPVSHICFHAQQRALQLAGGLVRGNRQNVDGEH